MQRQEREGLCPFPNPTEQRTLHEHCGYVHEQTETATQRVAGEAGGNLCKGACCARIAASRYAVIKAYSVPRRLGAANDYDILLENEVETDYKTMYHQVLPSHIVGESMTAVMDEVLVIGHHNPDTDAICSALAYADLYARLTGLHTVACYLDEIGPETEWLLNHLGLPKPRPIPDVYLRVADVMVMDEVYITPDATIRQAGLLMREQKLGALPVLERGRLIGVIARDLLADRYLDLLQLSAQIERPYAAVMQSLEAEVVGGTATGMLRGNVWLGTFSPEVARENIRPGDILIIEDDHDLQRAGVEVGVSCLIVASTAPIADDVRAEAEARGTVLLRTHHNSLAAAALLEQSIPIERVMERDPLVARPDDLVSEAQQYLRRGRLASLPVVDVDGHYRGQLLRRHLVPQNRRRVILTDHNHPSQAASGVTESDLLAIIDHHNLGGLQTLQPLTMQIDPVGCCCTLVAEAYQRAGLIPSPQLAGAMLGAILSDTVQFRSPTTTPRDQAAATWLAELSGKQIDSLARSMFRARLPNPLPPPDWWVGRDWKTYTFSNTSIGIAQIELVDVAQVMPPVEDLRRELAHAIKREELTTAFLMLTDILEQHSVLLAANEAGERIAEKAFGRVFAEHRLVLPGVMSRKKQMVPPIAAALAA